MTDRIDNIELSSSVARWLLKTATQLIQHYYGGTYRPELGILEPPTDPCEVLDDRVPRDDHELRYWIGTVIMLCKTVAGILNYQLQPDIDPLPLIDYPDPEDDDDGKYEI